MKHDLLQRAVDRILPGSTILQASGLSGGCIADVRLLMLSDHRMVIAKIVAAKAMATIEEEATRLEALARTGTVMVPTPFGIHHDDDHGVLLMTHIAPADDHRSTDWTRFGRDLAALHASTAATSYGFDIDNHCGDTPQPNTWHDDWVEFNRTCRIGFQVERAKQHGRLGRADHHVLRRVVDALSDLLPRHPAPALIHGDLWSGNAMPTTGGRVAVIDPAPSVGDGWADIAMMRLFGGFPESCHESYRSAVEPIEDDDLQRRLDVYQLYHVLNHVNLFGGGYLGQAMSIARRLLDH